MKVLKRVFLSAATATLIGGAGAYGQSTGNILVNPDMVLDANDGRTSQTVTGPSGASQLVFGGTAAAYWAYVTIRFGDFTLDTELVPSDFVPGSQMLHVRAHGVGFIQLRPIPSDTALENGHRATFCTWIKVGQGGNIGIAADDTTTSATPTGDWQKILDNTDHTTPNGPALTVVPRLPPGDPGNGATLGDVDFYVATADYTPRRLTDCPRATLDDVSYRGRPLIVPPHQPQVVHPDWGDRRRGDAPKPDQKQQQQFGPGK